MAAASEKKFFVNKKFYLHVKHSPPAHHSKTVEFIKLFGGQIEQFLDREISYVLTDTPKEDWPPNGKDPELAKARVYKVKLMSLHDLLRWCSLYLASSQSSSDEDDETNIKDSKPCYIKLEDYNCIFTPSLKEFARWPEFNMNAILPVGKSFFSDLNSLSTPSQSATNPNNHQNNSAQITTQSASMKNNNHYPQPNNIAQRAVKKRHSFFCEICGQKINDNIEEHIKTQTHRLNIEQLNWDQVNKVIESLPSLSTLNMRRLVNFNPPNGVEEFLCLHKVDSVSSLFSNKV